MKLTIARQYGFCFGVRRAIQLADEFKGELTTFGPLVHNPQEVARLEDKGVRSTLDMGAIKTPTILVRAHGIAPDVMEELKTKGAVIDGTCPLVKKVHGIGQMLHRQGYQVIIYGQREHPEVLGTQGYMGNAALVVRDADEARALRVDAEKLALIGQTTEIYDEFLEIEQILKGKYPHIRVFDTICQPTKGNQEAAMELAKSVELMIVVGGKHSSNTRKLVDNCAKHTHALHIESPAEIDAIDFSRYATVGMTAGASTPDWLFQQVVAKVKEHESQVLPSHIR